MLGNLEGQCSAIFPSRGPCPKDVIRRIVSLCNDLKCSSPSLPYGNFLESIGIDKPWRAPQFPWVKVNVDSAWKKISMHGGVECIIRDHEGKLFGGLSKFSIRSTSDEIEAEAIIEWMKLAKDGNHQWVIIENDSQEVISSLNNVNYHGHWTVPPFILEIRRLAPWFSSIK